MYIAYAIHANNVKKEYWGLFNSLNIKWVYGCYLNNEFMKHNDDYDQFLMNSTDIEDIKEKYKNGGEIPIRVVYGEDDYKDGILFYWNCNGIDRGLISTKDDEETVALYNERSSVI